MAENNTIHWTIKFHAQTGCSSAFNSVLEVEYTKFVGTLGYLVIVATILTMKVGS